MTITFEATYEDGVLKPDKSLNLGDRARVVVTLEPQAGASFEQGADVDPLDAVIGIGQGPRDGAENHDRYIYGSRAEQKK